MIEHKRQRYNGHGLGNTKTKNRSVLDYVVVKYGNSKEIHIVVEQKTSILGSTGQGGEGGAQSQIVFCADGCQRSDGT